MKVKGLVRHRFWGEYSAHIVLGFDSKEEREKCLLHLPVGASSFRHACGGIATCTEWRLLDPQKAAGVELAEPQLTRMIDRFVKFGADKKKILSMAKSIDFGEEFQFEIPDEDPNQLELKIVLDNRPKS